MTIVEWLRAEAELVALDRLGEAADKIERLQATLEILKIALDREGWPAGWGQIRRQVQDVLSQ